MGDYLLTIAGKSISALAQMVMLLILAARLSPGELATLLAVYALASVVASLGDLGLATFSMRERAYGDSARSDLALRLGDVLAAGAALLGCLVLFVAAFAHPPLFATIPLLAWGPLERVTENRALRLIADNRVPRVAAIVGGRRVLGLVLFIGLSVFIPGDWAFSLALLAAAGVAQFVIHFSVPISRAGGDISRLGMLREAVPFTFTSISGQMRSLDVPIITWALGGIPAAAYGLGARLASPAMLVFSAASNLILVRVRGYSGRSIRRLYLLVIGGSVTIVVLLLALARPIGALVQPVIPWMQGDSPLILALVASSYVFAGCSIVLGSVCVAFHLERTLLRINVTTVSLALGTVWSLSLLTQSGTVAATGGLVCYFSQTLALTAVTVWNFVRNRGPRD